MNWNNVKLIFGREMRDQLRDRRTLFLIAVLPLLLYPLMGMSIFQMTQFLRKDASPCAETVIFPDLDISATLALGKTASVALPPLPAGEYAFHCQMQMYRGVLIVHLNSDHN